MKQEELYAKAGVEALKKANSIKSKYKELENNEELFMELSMALISSYAEGYNLCRVGEDALDVNKYDKPYVQEGGTKWFVDINGNYTGDGITIDGHMVNDCVYRFKENEYNRYTNKVEKA